LCQAFFKNFTLGVKMNNQEKNPQHQGNTGDQNKGQNREVNLPDTEKRNDPMRTQDTGNQGNKGNQGNQNDQERNTGTGKTGQTKETGTGTGRTGREGTEEKTSGGVEKRGDRRLTGDEEEEEEEEEEDNPYSAGSKENKSRNSAQRDINTAFDNEQDRTRKNLGDETETYEK
jgi:hypothetical protein